ncbi:hypothetical protein ACQ4PT_004643 [Festuca glaucescens]
MEVTLRCFDLTDVDAMMAWASDPRVAAFCRWEPYISTESLLAYLRDTVLPHAPLVPRHLPRRRRPPRRRGVPGTHGGPVPRRARVFGEVEGLACVEALVDVDNAASHRVVEKSGFRREGVLRRHYWHKGRARDLVMYSFVSGDPLPQ